MKHSLSPKATGQPSLNRRIGLRIRFLRLNLGLTQTELAKRGRLPARRLSLCEQGVRGVSAGELYLLAHHLNVPVGYFYDNDPNICTVERLLDGDEALRQEAEHLIRAFGGIRNAAVRRELTSLIEAAAASPQFSRPPCPLA